MPNKYVDNLKNETDRNAGQAWQNDLNLPNLTTREWNEAADLASMGKSDEEIRRQILRERKGR